MLGLQDLKELLDLRELPVLLVEQVLQDLKELSVS